ncbi:MAG: hypothetical protein HWD92_00865 [Flavobacteriia bacterium]|nr:hypothetical protein [Flavobacteriia bacterium]
MENSKYTVDQLGFLMGMVHRNIRANVEEVIDQLPSVHRFEHMIILRLIKEKGQPLAQSELIGSMPALDRHRVSRLCAEVEDLGFIERIPNPENRRENLLLLKPAGEKLIEQFIQIARSANKHIFEGLSDQQVMSLFEMLHHILNNLENHTTEAS